MILLLLLIPMVIVTFILFSSESSVIFDEVLEGQFRIGQIPNGHAASPFNFFVLLVSTRHRFFVRDIEGKVRRLAATEFVRFRGVSHGTSRPLARGNRRVLFASLLARGPFLHSLARGCFSLTDPSRRALAQIRLVFPLWWRRGHGVRIGFIEQLREQLSRVIRAGTAAGVRFPRGGMVFLGIRSLEIGGGRGSVGDSRIRRRYTVE
mmetsp:Transcript_21296/g.44442  ORF Transcript_21296/g.44442 Transcript_21296/m.44442 type:complete len:207 (+) Transcript_21296:526-1146(+)